MTITREINELIAISKKVKLIDTSLNSVDLDTLRELGDPRNVKIVSFEVDEDDANIIREDDIITKFKSAFNVLSKRNLDTPKNECMSCRRLMCLRDVTDIRKIRKPLNSDIWSRLETF